MAEIERALRETIRPRVQDGSLPRMKPTRVWGGPGAGLTCDVCQQLVRTDQMEFEVQFLGESRQAPDVLPNVLHVHIACFAAWELERELWLRSQHA